MEDVDEEIKKLYEKADNQYRNLEKANLEYENAKKKLNFLQLMNTFKERKDTYYVGVSVTRDLQEVENIIGTRYQSKKSHFSTFLVIVIILPELVQSYMMENGFKMNISVLLTKNQLCKTVKLDEVKPVVIASTEFPIGSEVDISFFGKMDGKTVVFRIPTLTLNISYFLRPTHNKNSEGQCKNYEENLIKISEQYTQLEKILVKEPNVKCTLAVHNTFNFSDIGEKSFPDNLNKTIFKDGNTVEYEVLKNSIEPSKIKMVRIDPNFVEVESDAENVRDIKKLFANNMFINADLEILAMRVSILRFLYD